MSIKRVFGWLFVISFFIQCLSLTVQAAIIPQFDDRASSFSEGLIAVKMNGKWGYIDKTGTWAIKPQFSDDNGFKELNRIKELKFTSNYAPIKVDGKWGFINRAGDVVIKPQFEAVRPFSEGKAGVKLDGKWGFIDETGQIVLKPIYSYVGQFKEDLALVFKYKGEAYSWMPFVGVTSKVVRDLMYVDKSGTIAIQGPFQPVFYDSYEYVGFSEQSLFSSWISEFSEGLAAIRTKAGQLVYLDNKGKIVFEIPKEKNIAGVYPFKNGIAKAVTNNLKIQVVDKSGKFIIEPKEYKAMGNFSNEGLAYFQDSESNKFGYLDKSYKTIIQPQFKDANDFNNGFAMVRNDNVWGYIDLTGKIVIQPQFKEAGPFFEGLAPVKSTNGWGYIDSSGNYVMKPQFEEASDFSQGVAFVKMQGKYAMINKNFETIPPSVQPVSTP